LDLKTNYDSFAAGFEAFFPDLIRYAADLRAMRLPG
jgi:hypothetical protein